MSLKGKTLFITGASRGIGLAIALKAARDGANIAVAAKTETPHPKLPGTIHSAAQEIEKAGGKALPLVVDVREEETVKKALDQTAAHFGGIDRLRAASVDEIAEVPGFGGRMAAELQAFLQSPNRGSESNDAAPGEASG